jgi:hypothetical protein
MSSKIKMFSDDIEQIARSYLKSIRKSGRTNIVASLPPADPSDYLEDVWNEMIRAQQ